MKHEKNKVLLFFHVKAGLSDAAYVACGGKILYIPACHKIRHTRQRPLFTTSRRQLPWTRPLCSYVFSFLLNTGYSIRSLMSIRRYTAISCSEKEVAWILTALRGRCFQSAASNSTQRAASLLQCSSFLQDGSDISSRSGWILPPPQSKGHTYRKTVRDSTWTRKIKKIIPAVYSALALLTLASLTQAVALASAIVKQSWKKQ